MGTALRTTPTRLAAAIRAELGRGSPTARPPEAGVPPQLRRSNAVGVSALAAPASTAPASAATEPVISPTAAAPLWQDIVYGTPAGGSPSGAVRALTPQVRDQLRMYDVDNDGVITKENFEALSPGKQVELMQKLDAARTLGLLGTRRPPKVKSTKQQGGVPLSQVAHASSTERSDTVFSDIATLKSTGNVVRALLPDSLSTSPGDNYNAALVKTIRDAKKLIFLEGYELDRTDIVDLLIQRAREGVQVVVLFDSSGEAHGPKATLLQKMRDAKLPNLHVAEYRPVDSGKRFEQILHVKKVIADTPEGGLVELSGGINFNQHSLKNLDFGWQIEGPAVLHSLHYLLEHYQTTCIELPFRTDTIPTEQAVIKAAAAKIAAGALPAASIEIASAGVRKVEEPRDYPLAKLRQRAKLGQKLILSAKDVLDPGTLDIVKLANHNRSRITIVEKPMSAAEQEAFAKLKPELKKLGVNVLRHDQLVLEDSYSKLVVRELDAAIAARESIDVAAFALSSRDVIERLIRAKKAGCAVRVLVDDLSINDVLINRKAMAQLSAAGVPIKVVDAKVKAALAAQCGTTPDLLKLHAKLIVLGGNRVLGGSANFSDNGLNHNLESGYLVRSAIAAQTFTSKLIDPLWDLGTVPTGVERVPDAERAQLLDSVPVDTKIEDIRFVVFDFETTGFVPGHDERIIQMSAQVIRIKPDGSTDEFGKYDQIVDPGRDPLEKPFKISPEIQKLTGITDARVLQQGKRMREAMPEFVKFVQDAAKGHPTVMVGQNVPFDLRFLDFTMSRKPLAIDVDGKPTSYRFDSTYVDTVDVSTRLFPSEKSHNLDHQMQRLGIPPDPSLPRHDAFADVVYTGRSLAGMVAKGKLTKLRELLGEDILQFGDQTTFISLNGETRIGQLEYHKDKLHLSSRNKASGKLDKPERVRLVEVVDRKGHYIHVKVHSGTAANPRVTEGYVSAHEVGFRNPGAVFFELREHGIATKKANIITP